MPSTYLKPCFSARSKCGLQIADSSSSSSSKHSVGFLRIERNVTRTTKATAALGKRMMGPGRAWARFYYEELPHLSKKIVVPPEDEDDPTDYSAAIMQQYRYMRGEFRTGIEGLKGCTSLYIISRKAVYATHWWEDISFNPSAYWAAYDDDELFQFTVTDMLRDGGKFHAPLDANKIVDDYIKVYHIRSNAVYRQLINMGGNELGYSEQWDQTKATVGELVPKLIGPARWRDVEYYSADNNKVHDSKTLDRGNNLFKYDKTHVIGEG
ncbi:uncharacterized protein KD926_000061 [Aspergillus affinis]|uniref:uncharacterized protein n=1 Tax=Aspergillus affinis TaxID=1070780 RepID=UPI0022FEBC23|nr:uncharacterized protein KD926_000061 [Aspergillus affinis]KAI9037720.1 hypothetical protein KD926_000061 [Aspergillus affinis]